MPKRKIIHNNEELEPLLVSTKTAAELLDLHPQTLRNMRSQGTGAPYVKLGDSKNSQVMYKYSDLVEWVNSLKSSS